MSKTKAIQIGGNHYKVMKIQPIEYILANDLNFVEASVVKYVSRWRNKGGLDDLRKAEHLLRFLIEHEELNNHANSKEKEIQNEVRGYYLGLEREEGL